MKHTTISRTACGLLLIVLLLVSMGSGCRTEIGSYGINNPPSGEVTYFPPGPEFKLSKEAARKQVAAESGLEQATH